MPSPSARSIAECRERGWLADVVERRVHRFVTKDYLGCIDIIAVTDTGILGIQATGGGNSSHRRDKILAEPRMRRWLAAGARLEIWNWEKRGARGKRKLWQLRVVEISERDFEEQEARAA
jgi:hypothetical protein